MDRIYAKKAFLSSLNLTLYIINMHFYYQETQQSFYYYGKQIMCHLMTFWPTKDYMSCWTPGPSSRALHGVI